MSREIYDKIMSETKTIFVLKSINSLLHWDTSTYMPSTGGMIRGEQLALLKQVSKNGFKKIGQLIEKIDIDDLNELEKRNIDVLKRLYKFEAFIPDELSKEFQKQIIKTESSWKKARGKNDFNVFKNDLTKLVELVRKKSEYIDPSKEPFNVYLDFYEPEMDRERVSKLFSEFIGEIKDFRLDILNEKQFNNHEISKVFDFDENIQMKVANKITETIQFDLKGGRIDYTTHPFTMGNPLDVRMTIQKNGLSAVFHALHEGGHSIHLQNCLMNWEPINIPFSAGIGESQSRFYETIIGRSYSFWKYFQHDFKQITGKSFNLEEFYRYINLVENQPIRIQADELSYNFHIILRTEIEPMMLNEEISINELPDYWDQRFLDLFGYKVKNLSEGVLQDIHWSTGLFGYFPTYTIGNMYAGQIFHAMNKDFNVYEEVEKGNFSEIKLWLKEKIHIQGSRLDPLDLIKEVSGNEFSSKYYSNYLKEKFSNIN